MPRYKIIELLDRLCAEREPAEKAALADEIRRQLDEERALNEPPAKKKPA